MAKTGYSVVRCENEDSIAIVPSNWVKRNNTLLFWPPSKDKHVLNEAYVKHHEPVAGEWEDLRIVHFYGKEGMIYCIIIKCNILKIN